MMVTRAAKMYSMMRPVKGGVTTIRPDSHPCSGPTVRVTRATEPKSYYDPRYRYDGDDGVHADKTPSGNGWNDVKMEFLLEPSIDPMQIDPMQIDLGEGGVNKNADDPYHRDMGDVYDVAAFAADVFDPLYLK
jgi:hypothetical protein